MIEMTAEDSTALAALKKSLASRVIGPHDPEYDAGRATFYAGIDRRPAAIVRVANAEEVSRVLVFASDNGWELAVRSGGHSAAGHCVTEGGIVLDLSELRALEINVSDRTAWVQSGLTAGAYTAAVGAHGLATGFGDTGSVGIGGITLSGGIGYLVRKHSLTIDSLLESEIVTADGKILRVDSEQHPDLFWAIRGGGGNFGVVTRFKFRLHDVPHIVGGMLILPATPGIIASFVAAAEEAPEELSAIGNVMNAPPMPFLPPDVHGKPIVMATIVYSGDVEEGKKVVGRFQKLATPILDAVKVMPYHEIFPPEIPGYRPRAIGRTMFAEAIGKDTSEAILDQLSRSSATIRVAQLRVLGGAMARVPSVATAFAHRNERILVNVAAVYERPEESAIHTRWVQNLAAVIPRRGSGAYVGFLGDEGSARILDAYPEKTWNRLAAVKRRYDPSNVFRLNQNIPPAPK